DFPYLYAVKTALNKPNAKFLSLSKLHIFPLLPSRFFSSPFTTPEMKKSVLAASVAAAASATAASLSSSSHQDERRSRENTSSQNSSSTEKFAPRFDGLRFIETLVTAHR
ncbi:hypothetical protein D0Y65_034992, partial [Glycine soja]